MIKFPMYIKLIIRLQLIYHEFQIKRIILRITLKYVSIYLLECKFFNYIFIINIASEDKVCTDNYTFILKLYVYFRRCCLNSVYNM